LNKQYHHSTFRDTEKDADDDEFIEILGDRRTCGNKSKGNDEERKIVLGTDAFE